MANSGAEQSIIHRLLTAIEDDPNISQRRLSGDIGIAVGSVNWYLKRCLSRGLIKLQHAPVKRYLYYLTPKGFEEKARLTADFLRHSLELYRVGRQECSDFIDSCIANGSSRIFLAGDGDLAEIACLSSLGTTAKIIAVIDRARSRPTCVGISVFETLPAAVSETEVMPDAILLTDLRRPNHSYTRLMEEVDDLGLKPEMIHVPNILKFKPAHDKRRRSR